MRWKRAEILVVPFSVLKRPLYVYWKQIVAFYGSFQKILRTIPVGIAKSREEKTFTWVSVLASDCLGEWKKHFLFVVLLGSISRIFNSAICCCLFSTEGFAVPMKHLSHCFRVTSLIKLCVSQQNLSWTAQNLSIVCNLFIWAFSFSRKNWVL